MKRKFVCSVRDKVRWSPISRVSIDKSFSAGARSKSWTQHVRFTCLKLQTFPYMCWSNFHNSCTTAQTPTHFHIYRHILNEVFLTHMKAYEETFIHKEEIAKMSCDGGFLIKRFADQTLQYQPFRINPPLSPSDTTTPTDLPFKDPEIM